MTITEVQQLQVGDVVRLLFDTGRASVTGTIDEVREGPCLVISWHDEPGQGVLTEPWQFGRLMSVPVTAEYPAKES